eukprot:TRINITY_DN13292_c0_g1_i2.p1 TRINITY_DN13292_c0_g1~~TRINITY_DN13292_c0_g1_i2.p1  ORF type:complete len:241 (+),score=-30.19 TRINITY_DN13292_c0_g1_i2:1229-1951(+)
MTESKISITNQEQIFIILQQNSGKQNNPMKFLGFFAYAYWAVGCFDLSRLQYTLIQIYSPTLLTQINTQTIIELRSYSVLITTRYNCFQPRPDTIVKITLKIIQFIVVGFCIEQTTLTKLYISNNIKYIKFIQSNIYVLLIEYQYWLQQISMTIAFNTCYVTITITKIKLQNNELATTQSIERPFQVIQVQILHIFLSKLGIGIQCIQYIVLSILVRYRHTLYIIYSSFIEYNIQLMEKT